MAIIAILFVLLLFAFAIAITIISYFLGALIDIESITGFIGLALSVLLLYHAIPAVIHWEESFSTTVQIYEITEDSECYLRESGLFYRARQRIQKGCYAAEYRLSKQPPTVYIYKVGQRPYKIDFFEWIYLSKRNITTVNLRDFYRYRNTEWSDSILLPHESQQ